MHLLRDSRDGHDVVCGQTWQGQALDALAAWLAEDGARVEPRLASREACQRFVALFAAYAPAGDSEALSRLLDAFLRILRRSPRITVRGPHNILTTPLQVAVCSLRRSRPCCEHSATSTEHAS